MTIYSIDPLGLDDSAGLRATFYEEFLKPVTVPKNTQAGNLALQVIAIQSGGLALRAEQRYHRSDQPLPGGSHQLLHLDGR